MQVVHHRVAHLAVFAVDASHLLLDFAAHRDVALDAFTARRRQLHDDVLGRVDAALFEQFAERVEPNVDSLGVVQAIDAEHDALGVAQILAQLLGAIADGLGTRFGVEVTGIDGDRERADSHGPEADLHDAQLGPHSDGSAGRGSPGEASGKVEEVLRAAGQVETDEVGTEQSFDDLGAPRHLHEQLDRRERDVQEEPDGQVGAQHPQHLRDELELVVLDPDRRALCCGLGGLLGEPAVDLDVGVPPVAVVLRLDDDVVIQRPQCRVGEAS